MAYEGRIFVSWAEAAELLGTDAEGLRQLFLYRLRNVDSDTTRPWLRVYLQAPGDGFMARLCFEPGEITCDLHWHDRDTFYDRVDGKRDRLNFSDGSSLALVSRAGSDHWDATHGYGCGWSHCFAVGGDTLVVSPDGVRHACEQGGRPDHLLIAPRNWCEHSFPDKSFLIVECDNSFYKRRPSDLYAAAVFRREEVLQIGRLLSQSSTANDEGTQLDSRERNSLLRIIRALDVMANLPARGAATSIEAQLRALGFQSPSEATIRSAIEKARNLAPDAIPQ